MFEASKNTEDYVVACLMLNPAWVAEARSVPITTDDASVVMRSILALYEIGGGGYDSVAADLEARGANLTEYLTWLIDTPVDYDTFVFHVKQLRDAEELRQAYQGHKAIGRIFTGQGTAGEKLEAVRETLADLVILTADREDSLLSIDKALEKSEPPRILKTGYKTLDSVFGGYRAGRVVIVAARTSHGKTVFCVDNMLRMARNHRCLYLTPEMGKEAITNRMLSNLSGVESMRFDLGLREEDQAAVDRATNELRQLPIFIDTEPRPTTAHIFAQAQRCAADVVFFDYLSYTGEKHDNPTLKLEKALHGCQEIAKRLGIVIVVVMQLNRAIDSRANGTPHLSDLAWCGAAEQVAYLVIMLYHEWTHKTQQGDPAPDADPNRLDVYVRKNTHGRIGSTMLQIDRACVRLTDPAESTASAPF